MPLEPEDDHTMTATTETMSQLHRIHKQLTDRRERLEAGPHRVMAHEARFAKLENDKALAKENATQLRMAIDSKQLLLQTAENKISELKGKLNACSSNREYQALSEQIAAAEMANSVLEDEILEAMDRSEQLALVVTEAEGEVFKGVTFLADAKQSVSEEEQAHKLSIAQLKSELAEAEMHLPDEVRSDYDRIVRTRHEDSMAAVEGDICIGCYQKITPNMVNLLAMKKVVICKACGRLLYLAEQE
jgi:predicted  nucleic acid-binding Zn-ribbon protein